jgi:hypothetical protein
LPAQFFARAIKAFIQARVRGLFQVQAVSLSHSGGTAGKRQCTFRPVVCRCGNRKRIEYPRHVCLVVHRAIHCQCFKVHGRCLAMTARFSGNSGQVMQGSRDAKAFILGTKARQGIVIQSPSCNKVTAAPFNVTLVIDRPSERKFVTGIPE